MGEPAPQSLDLASYIANLSADIKGLVYSSSWTAQALFRALTPLAKQFILRIIYADGGVHQDTMQLWLRPAAQGLHLRTMHQLHQLSVLQTDQRGFVQLNADFKRCLIAALSGRDQGVSDATQQQYQGPPPVRQLSEQAARQWQAVLLFILDSEGSFDLPLGSSSNGFSIQDLLVSAGLVVLEGRRHELTPEGLKYLLQPTPDQVWLLLRQYIQAAEQTSGKELASTLSFLMQLSFRRVWQPYPLAGLTPREQDIAGHMCQLGLVATCKQDGASFFCATPLAASLCGGSGAAGQSDAAGDASSKGGGGASALESSGYIIVETNFRVYAHTSNPLQRRVLARLMRTDCLLPNLYVGTLTRETFMEALEAGLGAEDVTNFLRAHAHPQVASRVVAVPENVQDQLLLWQAETQRVTRQAATYYSKFEDDELFAATLHTAQGHGSVLWWYRQEANPEASFILIKRSGHEALKNFIVEYKKQRQQRQM